MSEKLKLKFNSKSETINEGLGIPDARFQELVEFSQHTKSLSLGESVEKICSGIFSPSECLILMFMLGSDQIHGLATSELLRVLRVLGVTFGKPEAESAKSA